MISYNVCYENILHVTIILYLIVLSLLKNLLRTTKIWWLMYHNKTLNFKPILGQCFNIVFFYLRKGVYCWNKCSK